MYTLATPILLLLLPPGAVTEEPLLLLYKSTTFVTNTTKMVPAPTPVNRSELRRAKLAGARGPSEPNRPLEKLNNVKGQLG